MQLVTQDYYGVPEVPQLDPDEGTFSVFSRDFFPGQPFVDNQFDTLGIPIIMCTPSMESGANRGASGPLLLAIIGVALAIVVLAEM